MRKLLYIHLSFLGISAIVYGEGITQTGPDLIWNMFLALIAYDSAYLARYFKSKSGWIYGGLALLWLAFYPNTFYMVTDLVHMHWVDSTLWNRESLHLFMAFVPSIFFGVLCGIESWRLILKDLSLTWWQEHALIVSLSFISSLAIYIGRYDRLNSWDLLHHPYLVVQKLADSIQRENLLFILGFTLIQVLSLTFLSEKE